MTTWIPDTCTLPTAERPLRLAEWDALFAETVTAVSRTGMTAVTLTLSSVDGVADLVARESECCSFLSFATSGDTLTLEAPPSCEALMSAIAERAAGFLR